MAKYRIEAEALNDEAAELVRQFIEDTGRCNLTAFEPEDAARDVTVTATEESDESICLGSESDRLDVSDSGGNAAE